MRPCPEFYGNDAVPVSIKAQGPADVNQPSPQESRGRRAPQRRPSFSAANSGMARTVARGPHIGELFPANRHFGQQPSNPRAQVRLLPGSYRLPLRNPASHACSLRSGAGSRLARRNRECEGLPRPEVAAARSGAIGRCDGRRQCGWRGCRRSRRPMSGGRPRRCGRGRRSRPRSSRARPGRCACRTEPSSPDSRP